MRSRSEQMGVLHSIVEEGLGQDMPTIMRISGHCMSPLLEDGDAVSLRHARIIFPGDVIVFRTSTTFVAHRVLGFRPGLASLGVVTRGDHCSTHDGVIPRERILGKVDLAIPFRQRVTAVAAFLFLVVERMVRRG